ncbi:hypothetical protein [Mycoplasma sp. 2575]
MLLHKDITTKKYTWIYYRWLKQLRTYLEYSDDAYLSVDSMNFNISSKNMKHAEYGKPKVDERLP